jgi:hypothetical protein
MRWWTGCGWRARRSCDNAFVEASTAIVVVVFTTGAELLVDERTCAALDGKLPGRE